MTKHSSSTLTINLSAICGNYRLLKSMSKAECAAVVKANGYGTGALQATEVLLGEGCGNFFVATADEALELSSLIKAAKAQVYTFNGLPAPAIDDYVSNNITPVLISPEQVELWQSAARKYGRKLPAIVHIDTGMNRLGFTNQDFEKMVSNWPDEIDFKYIMSHLACADDPAHPLNHKQLLSFKHAAGLVAGKGIRLSLSNSSGIFLNEEYHFDLLRPGIALYGMNPTFDPVNPMLDVIELKADILQIRNIEQDGTVGYSATRNVSKGSRLATAGLGYADGVPWQLSNHEFNGYIGDIPIPLMGRVTMDLLVFDVSHVPEAILNQNSQIEIIGVHNKVDDIADKIGVISYEILTSLGKRPKRIYI